MNMNAKKGTICQYTHIKCNGLTYRLLKLFRLYAFDWQNIAYLTRARSHSPVTSVFPHFYYSFCLMCNNLYILCYLFCTKLRFVLILGFDFMRQHLSFLWFLQIKVNMNILRDADSAFFVFICLVLSAMFSIQTTTNLLLHIRYDLSI